LRGKIINYRLNSVRTRFGFGVVLSCTKYGQYYVLNIQKKLSESHEVKNISIRVCTNNLIFDVNSGGKKILTFQIKIE